VTAAGVWYVNCGLRCYGPLPGRVASRIRDSWDGPTIRNLLPFSFLLFTFYYSLPTEKTVRDFVLT
jgi:hypothetical protein